MKTLLYALSVCLPWPLRRRVLRTFFGYEIHPTARIGLAWIRPRRLVMEAHTRIGHLTVFKNADLLHLKAHSLIGRGNWITGFPAGNRDFFAHQTDRKPALILGEHSAITNRHLIDCTDRVTIGKFTTVAGFQSQLLSHSIDLEKNRQNSQPIRIGDYCFIGTNCVLLGGSALPDFSVLGAKSLLNKAHTDTHRLYGGVPAKALKELPRDLGYFKRAEGFVH
ncbi:MAG: acyltransferase [Verrucomicrobia bacterium]|nr:acyltransferase [Verrucomicrobiota bacterium]